MTIPFDKPFDYTQDRLRTQLCANGTHVYLTGSLTCTCGQAANGYQPLRYNLSTSSRRGSGQAGAMMYPFPNNYAPPRPNTPPTLRHSSGQAAGEAPPLHVFEAAQRAGASHLSMDGRYIYTVRYGETLEAEWKERLRNFGAWSVVESLPADAVAM